MDINQLGNEASFRCSVVQDCLNLFMWVTEPASCQMTINKRLYERRRAPEFGGRIERNSRSITMDEAACVYVIVSDVYLQQLVNVMLVHHHKLSSPSLENGTLKTRVKQPEPICCVDDDTDWIEFNCSIWSEKDSGIR